MAGPDDELQTVIRYIREGVERYAHQTDRVRRLEEEGRDAGQAQRALRDLEETLTILRQRHKCLALDARSRRLLAVSRQKLARGAARSHRPKS